MPINFVFSLLFFDNCYAQVTLKDSTATLTDNLLKDLRKAGDDEIDHSKPLILDGVSIPVISEDGKSLSGEELMKVMMTGDDGIDPYFEGVTEYIHGSARREIN
ncbi:MAG: hypothetical protein NTV87_05690 [Ignavibacteriae bacterium]|nr:hypothetical protein [Ignavibacteriota bacterium]